MDLFKKIIALPFVVLFMITFVIMAGSYFIAALVRTWSFRKAKEQHNTFLDRFTL